MRIKVDVYHHFGTSDPRIGAILHNTEKIIMANAEILALVSQIDVATNKVADRIQALIDKIDTGMSAAEVAEVKAALGQEVTDLETLGKDPADPVPAPAPPEG
jgi:hypothetical protein